MRKPPRKTGKQTENRAKVNALLDNPLTAGESSRRLAERAGVSWWLIEQVRKERQRKASA